jgi:hypothetical protein
MNEPPSNSGAFIAKLGAGLQLAQVIGFAIGFARAAPSMMKAFHELDTAGPGDPALLSAFIGEILIAVLIAATGGIALSLIGILLVLIAITFCRYRAVWMFWFLCLYGSLMIFIFWYFLPFGLFFLVFGLVKKDEFLRPAPRLQPDRF